jgi:para-nitrobenzyl esterase
LQQEINNDTAWDVLSFFTMTGEAFMKTPTMRIPVFAFLLFVVSVVPGMQKNDGSGLALNVCAAASWADNATVTTNRGPVRGFEDNYTTWVWKAIPYASPPVGELRWQAPQDPVAWTEIKQSKEFCSWCPQTGDDNGATVFKGSEDCLYVNIWRPRSSEKDLPVYFWIHGGSNKVGSADPYIGAPMAGKHNMVVVTINYRLGPLGWFTHPALREGQDPLNSSGNYAILDIIKALAWVRDNIGAFGGNPNNITVAGQSAGGVNDLIMMVSPKATGLFHRVISQSGGLSTKSVEDGDEYANSVIEALLVKDGTPADQAGDTRKSMSNDEIRAYLRSKTPADFFGATAGLSGNPDVFNDGAVIPAEGADAFDDPAKYNQVPIILGSTSEEGKLFMFLFGVDKFLPKSLYQLVGKRGTRISRITGLDSLAYKMSAHPSQPGVYCYIFEYGQYRRLGYNAWPTDTGPTDKMSWAVALGACHGLDIPFNFGLIGSFPVFDGLENLVFREDNRPGWEALSDAMMAYTAQFARTGNPNAAGLPEWTAWPHSKLSPGPRFMILDADETGAVLKMARDAR